MVSTMHTFCKHEQIQFRIIEANKYAVVSKISTVERNHELREGNNLKITMKIL